MGARPPTAFARALLSGLGAGRLRPAPGTWASATVTAAAGLAEAAAGAGVAVAAALALVGAAASVAFAGTAQGEDGAGDPGWVVSDEWAGQGLALLAALPGASLPRLLAAFALFRVFDVLKPWPLSALERAPGGWGVLLDDVGAGVLAGAVLLGARALFAL